MSQETANLSFDEGLFIHIVYSIEMRQHSVLFLRYKL